MTVRIKASKDIKRLTEERNAAMQVNFQFCTFLEAKILILMNLNVMNCQNLVHVLKGRF